MAGKEPGAIRSRRRGARTARLRVRAAQGNARSDRRLRRGLLLLPRGSRPRNARTACRMEMLVRPRRGGAAQEIGDGRKLFRVQGISRRAQSAVLPLEMDAALSRIRLASLH